MGTLRRIGATAGTISITTTVDLDASSAPQGAARKLYLTANVTVAADTPSWVITAQKRIGGNLITIGASAAIVATGLAVIVLDAAFDGKDANSPNHAIPLPDRLVFTRTTGDLAAEIYAAIV